MQSKNIYVQFREYSNDAPYPYNSRTEILPIYGISLVPSDGDPFYVLEPGRVVTLKLRTSRPLEPTDFKGYSDDHLRCGLFLVGQSVDSIDKSGDKIHARKYYADGYSSTGLLMNFGKQKDGKKP